jgi:pimeloyl-ACP methyl ester carboxylesterase
MTTFVLVAGAWLGGWAWQETAEALRARGHEPLPLTLTGLDGNAAPEANLSTHIEDIVAFADKHDLRDFALVGHSYGGVPVTGAAARLGDRLAHVIYVDSAPFTEGMRMLDLMSPEAAEELRSRVTGGLLPLPSFDVLAQSASLDGLDDDQLERLRARAVPHPFGSYEQPLPAPATLAPHVGRAVVACHDFQRLLDAGVPALASVTRPPWRRVDLDTGHWPMFSEPAALAAALAEATA